jgi:hypothetical protein
MNGKKVVVNGLVIFHILYRNMSGRTEGTHKNLSQHRLLREEVLIVGLPE